MYMHFSVHGGKCAAYVFIMCAGVFTLILARVYVSTSNFGARMRVWHLVVHKYVHSNANSFGLGVFEPSTNHKHIADVYKCTLTNLTNDSGKRFAH